MVTRVVTSLGDSSGLGLSFGPATMGRRRSPTILETFFGWIVFGLLILLVFSLVMLGITTAVHGNPALTALAFFGIPTAVIWFFVARRRRYNRSIRERAQQELERQEQERLQWQRLTPRQFEEAIADMLYLLGYYDVRRVGRSGDQIADVLAKDPEDGGLVVVQCKRHAPGIAVGSKEVQTFIGMAKVHHEADHAIFVTTSHFTEPAWRLAEAHGIELWDGLYLGLLKRIILELPQVRQGHSGWGPGRWVDKACAFYRRRGPFPGG